MKPRLSLLLLLAACALPATAAVRHTGVSLHTYVNIATNSGRYVTAAPNALLLHLRQRDGGVRIPYTTGQPDYTLPHGVPDFSAVSDMANTTAVAYNYIATVAHNASRLYPTFTANDAGLGPTHTRRYMVIEEYGATRAFVHHIFHGTNDFKLSRLCRLATDITPVTMTAGPDFKGQHIYRVGGGFQQLRHPDGKNSDESIQDAYTVAGIAGIVNWRRSGNDMRVHHGTVIGTTSWGAEGAGPGTPLPFGSTPGDSGSPYFVWQDGEFRFLMAHHGSTNNGQQTLGCEATDWALATMAADCVPVDMARVRGRLIISGAEKAEDKGGVTETFNGQQVTISPACCFLRDDAGNMYDPAGNALVLHAVPAGQRTWKSLADRRELDTWYAYGPEYLNAGESVFVDKKEVRANPGLSVAQLFLTRNLVLHAAKDGAHYTVELTADTDMGAGYLHFAAEKCRDVRYSLGSADGAQLHTAGYMVDAGVTAELSLRNADATATPEWRKVGAGTLKICGNGNNEILLNVGGPGLTLLEQEKGYAAYNVLVNTGSTLRIADPQQIARDLTIGAGGGTLDLNGNSLEWYTTAQAARPGFSIRALTEQATIANSRAQAEIIFKEGGRQCFPGSFADAAKAPLRVVYAGGGHWQLSGTHTALQHPASGLTVQNGTVTLTGTPTLHGDGTIHSRETASHSTRPNDWHYADAAMHVKVAPGAVFELASHARLRGTVSVQADGTYTMHEGVQHDSELVEGGEHPENTAALADFYGHKGDIELAEGATLRLVSSAETDTTTHYSGKVSGAGNLVVESATEKAAFHLSEALKSLNIAIRSGRLILSNAVSASHVSIEPGATLALRHGGRELLTLSSKEQKAELLFADIKLTSPTEVTIGHDGATHLRMRHAALHLTSGSTLSLVNTDIRPDSTISADGATLRLLGSAIYLGSAPAGRQAAQSVPTYTCTSLQGKLTLTAQRLLLDLSALKPAAGTLRVQFAPGVQLRDIGSVRATIGSGTTIPGTIRPGEPNAVYFRFNADSKKR